MVFRRSISVIFAVASLLLFCDGAQHGNQIPKTIILEGDLWAPYVISGTGVNKGFILDIAEAVFKQSGYKVEFRIIPWSRTLSDVKNGSADGALGIYFSQAGVEGFVIPSEEIGLSINKFFVKSDTKWIYQGEQSLKRIRLGLIDNYDYGSLNSYVLKQVKANSGRVEFVSGNGAIEKNLNKLFAGRVDVIVEDYLVEEYYVKTKSIGSKIKEAGTLVPENKVGICFSPKRGNSVKYAKILSDGIVQMRKSGQLKGILDKYGVKDWKLKLKSSH